MSDVERELGLDRDRLVELAMLLGSDYTEVGGGHRRCGEVWSGSGAWTGLGWWSWPCCWGVTTQSWVGAEEVGGGGGV